MEAKDVEARIKGDLENFAKDCIECYQKTGLVYTEKLLDIYSKRLMKTSFKEGIREVVRDMESIAKDSGDTRDFSQRIDNLILEWRTKLGESGLGSGKQSG